MWWTFYSARIESLRHRSRMMRPWPSMNNGRLFSINYKNSSIRFCRYGRYGVRPYLKYGIRKKRLTHVVVFL
jgi:hypothetical protein